MRLLVVLLATVLVAIASPAWAWMDSEPGGKYWPPIPEPGGMANFIDTWTPVCNHGAWQEHGDMTLHADGKISYKKKNPYLATRYRVVETTPYYVVLMTHRISKENGEILRFVVLQSLSPPPDYPDATLGWNECRPFWKDLVGFKWTDDDAALARVWAESKSCNPKFKTPDPVSPFFGAYGWSQECGFLRHPAGEPPPRFSGPVAGEPPRKTKRPEP